MGSDFSPKDLDCQTYFSNQSRGLLFFSCRFSLFRYAKILYRMFVVRVWYVCICIMYGECMEVCVCTFVVCFKLCVNMYVCIMYVIPGMFF